MNGLMSASSTLAYEIAGKTFSVELSSHQGFHASYSSMTSHIISDASVPPTLTIDRSSYNIRTEPIGPEYVLTSLYSLRGLTHGYLERYFAFQTLFPTGKAMREHFT